MKLDDLTNNFQNSLGETSNLWDSPRFDNISNALGGFENAKPMLVTSTWQTLLESPDLSNKLYPQALRNISTYPSLNNHLEKYLLCLGNNNYCLLVFDPTLTLDEPILVDASKNNTRKSIKSGYGIWKSKMNNSIISRNNFDFSFRGMKNLSKNENQPSFTPFNAGIYNEQILNTFKPQVFEYCIHNSEWPMIICKPPQKISHVHFQTHLIKWF